MLRATITAIAIAAFAFILARSAFADEVKCEGAIVAIDGDTVTVKDMTKEHQMKIEPATKITSAGKPVMVSDLKVGQNFQQKRLKGFIGAIDLVDQQNRRSGRIGFERLQERPLDQKALGKYVVLQPLAVMLAFGFGGADRDHLRRVVPFVNRRGDIEPLITLQADEPPAQCSG